MISVARSLQTQFYIVFLINSLSTGGIDLFDLFMPSSCFNLPNAYLKLHIVLSHKR